jgi:hypothetical protein
VKMWNQNLKNLPPILSSKNYLDWILSWNFSRHVDVEHKFTGRIRQHTRAGVRQPNASFIARRWRIGRNWSARVSRWCMSIHWANVANNQMIQVTSTGIRLVSEVGRDLISHLCPADTGYAINLVAVNRKQILCSYGSNMAEWRLKKFLYSEHSVSL